MSDITDSKIKSIIEKITKLRALQNSSNVHEASNAAAMAEKLIQEYNISEAELNASTGKTDPIITGAVLYSSARLVPWKSNLAIRLAGHYGVLVYDEAGYTESRYEDDGYGGKKFVKSRRTRNYRMVGRESDIGLLHFNFCFFLFEIERLADMNCNKKRGVSVEKLQYCAGAVAGIMSKLEEEKRIAVEKASAQAIVLINNKIQEAEKALPFKLGRSSYHSNTQRDASAYERGFTAGGNIQASTIGTNHGANKLT